MKAHYEIADLLQVMEILRGENGCPWDREQTHKSIRKDFIEEAYEVVEAIDKDDPAMLREELGDVLLNVVFQSKIAEEAQEFSFDDVVHEICHKMIIRHPHVFGEVTVTGTEDVLTNWEAIKNNVKGIESVTETLRAVPTVFPALMRAQKIVKRAAKAGMGFASPAEAFSDVEAELSECKEASRSNDRERMEAELGDLLFAAANLARHLGIDSEEALGKASERYVKRFAYLEEAAKAEQVSLTEMSEETRARLWNKAKEC